MELDALWRSGRPRLPPRDDLGPVIAESIANKQASKRLLALVGASIIVALILLTTASDSRLYGTVAIVPILVCFFSCCASSLWRGGTGVVVFPVLGLGGASGLSSLMSWLLRFGMEITQWCLLSLRGTSRSTLRQRQLRLQISIGSSRCNFSRLTWRFLRVLETCWSAGFADRTLVESDS